VCVYVEREREREIASGIAVSKRLGSIEIRGTKHMRTHTQNKPSVRTSSDDDDAVESASTVAKDDHKSFMALKCDKCFGRWNCCTLGWGGDLRNQTQLGESECQKGDALDSFSRIHKKARTTMTHLPFQMPVDAVSVCCTIA
jgi:hypothetical protein